MIATCATCTYVKRVFSISFKGGIVNVIKSINFSKDLFYMKIKIKFNL